MVSEIVGGGAETPNPKNIAIHGSSIFTLTDKGLVRTETGSKRQQVIVSDVGGVGSVIYEFLTKKRHKKILQISLVSFFGRI